MQFSAKKPYARGMKGLVSILALVMLGNVYSRADLYMHNPRDSGALVTLFQSPALDKNEISSGRLIAKNRKWSPISFVMQGGDASIGKASLRYVQKAFKSGKPVDLDFSEVNVDTKGARHLVYRIHFDGAVITSLKTTENKGQTTTSITFTFAKTIWSLLRYRTTTQDTWR